MDCTPNEPAGVLIEVGTATLFHHSQSTDSAAGTKLGGSLDPVVREEVKRIPDESVSALLRSKLKAARRREILGVLRASIPWNHPGAARRFHSSSRGPGLKSSKRRHSDQIGFPTA